ncbi:hypothetical protein JCM19046_1401 [Bacillus sp. JCM 19046]|nr:hypothetical protein JCM19045_576 [Bacillus sp. JCM 19045]GAF16935.1 hypothetical protein JCM19046_1401 [Bacillus sp. JCM 19046]
MINYRIEAHEGLAQRVGELLSMLDYTRRVTLKDVENLTIEELDYVPEHGSNSIGALLLHMATVERVHQIITTEHRDITAEEEEFFEPALSLGEKAREQIKRQPIEFYIKALDEARQATIRKLKHETDEWLLKEDVWDNGVTHNYYYIWFHVMEDEISHRGQIRLIKRMMKQSVAKASR